MDTVKKCIVSHKKLQLPLDYTSCLIVQPRVINSQVKCVKLLILQGVVKTMTSICVRIVN